MYLVKAFKFLHGSCISVSHKCISNTTRCHTKLIFGDNSLYFIVTLWMPLEAKGGIYLFRTFKYMQICMTLFLPLLVVTILVPWRTKMGKVGQLWFTHIEKKLKLKKKKRFHNKHIIIKVKTCFYCKKLIYCYNIL